MQVGNEAIDQLVKFNAALADHSSQVRGGGVVIMVIVVIVIIVVIISMIIMIAIFTRQFICMPLTVI